MTARSTTTVEVKHAPLSAVLATHADPGPWAVYAVPAGWVVLDYDPALYTDDSVNEANWLFFNDREAAQITADGFNARGADAGFDPDAAADDELEEPLVDREAQADADYAYMCGEFV